MVARTTPLQLARRAVRASLLSYGLLFTPILLLIPVVFPRLLLGPHPSVSVHIAYDVVCCVLALSPGIASAYLFYGAVRQFEQGAAQDLWTDEEFESAATWLKSRDFNRKWNTFRWVPWVLSGALLALVCALAKHLGPSPSSDYSFWFTLYPSSFLFVRPGDRLTRLRKLFAPPKPAPTGGWSGTIGRLHSDHWGGRPPLTNGS